MFVVVYFFALGAGLFVVFSVGYWSLHNGISPMPSSTKAAEAIARLLPQSFEGTCYDVGSGFGTLLNHISRTRPQAKFVGIETSTVPFAISRVRFSMRRDITLQRVDFFDVCLSEADVIVCYLYPNAMQRLGQKFAKELRDEAIVISNTFAIVGWTPCKVVEIADLYRTKIYVYRKSAADQRIGQ